MIQPWLNVRNSRDALAYYKAAFGATELYNHDGGVDGVVAKLGINGAEFWISEESPEHRNFSPDTVNGTTTRIILIVPDPERVLERASKCGAREVSPVSESHGWRTGRLVDPFGHYWEIGCPVG
jgi:PhnB protein